jgi:translocation and assembly module TamA
MAPRLPVVALVVALCAGCMTTRGRPGEPPVLYGIELEGVRAFDADDIVERLATRASDRFAWQEARRLDPDTVAVDRRRVEAYYRERGYYGARVTDVRVQRTAPGKAEVFFQVEEGRPVRVARVEVTGLDEIPDAARRFERLPLREGEVFTEGDYDATRGALLRTLRNDGWANAEVKQEAQVLPDEGTATVRYTVLPGKRFRFGPVFVAGTATVPRDRIREQAGIEIRPGAWFAESALARAQARVFDLGVFGGVRVTRGTPDEQRGVIPIVVAVREAPFRTVRAGPGVGVQANTRWDVNGAVGWANRNFQGDLRRLSTDLRVGYAWLFTPPGNDGFVGVGAVEFSQPGAISRRIDASARLEVERGLEQAYDFWSERLRLALPVRIAPRWTFVPSYNLEVYQLSDAFSGSRTAGGRELENCQGGVCLLSFLEQRVGWDGRDDPVNTRRGLYVFLAVQEGFNLGGYGYRYLRFLPEARAFLPVGDWGVLAVRARVGALVPVNETGAPPIVARFTGGGPQSMRGYYTGRLSPMRLEAGDWIAVGGNGLADGTVELRFDIAGSLGGALFLDAGNVSLPSGSPTAYRTVLDPTELQWATGFGLRYRTPFGPVRFDVGVQVPTNLSSGVEFDDRFPAVPAIVNPGPGIPSAHREPWIAFHLSLGEAF